MISKQMRFFNINGEDYQFNSHVFKIYAKQFAIHEEITVTNTFEIISQAVNVTPEAVKQWYYGNNGPSDMEIIIGIAKAIKTPDYLSLMKKAKKVKENESVGKLTTLQMESLKRIYDAVIDYLDDFNKTGGFTTTLWYKFRDEGSENPENDIYLYAEEKVESVLLVIQKEYFYLRDTEVYSQISEYAENDLYNIFNGKLGYAYRFEAVPGEDTTTADDYIKAYNRLNEIIEEYT